MLKLANAIIAIVGGIGGAMLAYYLANRLVEALPERVGERLRPYVFVGPALFIVAVFLVYPTLRTILRSFYDRDGATFIGADNYAFLFGEAGFRETLVNNLLWIAVVPAFCVAIGLAVAVLADRLSARSESLAKSTIFLPMAISFVGASTIWGFVYNWRRPGSPQIGILNAVVTAFGGEPIDWLAVSEGNLNDLLLMIIMIWLQAGFAMVLLSAAIKNVPEDTIEAARIDGATQSQIFWRVVVPQIRSSVAVVFTTIVILVMKVFDVVYVMTQGRNGTDVIGNRFFNLRFNQPGRAAAIVVVLLLAVVPVMVFNIRRFRAEEGLR